MPIKPENAKRYPRDWTQVRARILARAGGRCEECGVFDREWIQRRHGAALPGEAEFRSADPKAPGDGFWRAAVQVILTIAHHPDPSPENCDDGNLLALCQRCHNRIDAPHRRRNASATLAAKRAAGTGSLPL